MLSLYILNGGENCMIVYYKLDTLLDERKITKTQLCKDTGISTNVVSKISKNEVFKTDTLNRICEYLHVQPSEIMEWIPDAEYNKANEEIASIEAQIAELKAKKKQLQGK
jgi:DNA-binding Xre family transcriptional regulator